jgi:hypothetical protein
MADDIRKNATAWCETVQSIVTNPAVASCIKRRCKDAWIVCGDPENHCSTHPNALGYRVPGKSSANLCIKNFSNANATGAIVIHEWAHSCNWRDGQGQGVPGGDGYLNTDHY